MRPPSTAGSIPYRAHIDGLRAVAVVAVVLYHAKLFSVTGGFIGVDIFFVISGFLIAATIVRDLNAGSFSLAAFWERRVRRIIPIFFVVILSTVTAAYFLLLYPPDFLFFGKAVVTQSTFTSNILFMITDGYFDEHARSSPLLHTWSLSVEEQFYIFFPLIVLFCSWFWKHREQDTRLSLRVSRQLFLLVIILGVLSLLMNVWFVNITPHLPFKVWSVPDWVFGGATYRTVGFYILFTRAWELALGVLVAFSITKIRSLFMAEVLSASGLISIIASIFVLTDATPFPGLLALIPTLGATAFIIANEQHSTMAGKLLSQKALVFVGLISYSLYLWHWPLFVFAKLASPTHLSSVVMVGLCLMTTLLSYLSYRFIELPFRKKTLIKRRGVVFLLGGAALSVVALSGSIIERYANSASGRIPPAAKHVLEATSENVLWGGICFEREGDQSLYGGLCRIGDAKQNVDAKFVVWGDSHAEAMVPLLNTLGRAYGVQGVVFDAGNCPPIILAHQIPPAPGCEKEKNNALQYIKDNNITHIILIARWSYYITGGQNKKLAALITDSNTNSITPRDSQQVFKRTLVPLVTQLSREGRSVYIVEQVPEQFKFDIRDIFYHAVQTNEEAKFESVSLKESNRVQALPDEVIRSLITLPSVHIINPADILCKNGPCDVLRRGKLIYRDESHLSTIGSTDLEPLFTPMFKSISK